MFLSVVAILSVPQQTFMLATLLPAPTSANVFGTGIANSDPQSKCTVAQSKFSKPFIKFKKIAPRENSLIYSNSCSFYSKPSNQDLDLFKIPVIST